MIAAPRPYVGAETEVLPVPLVQYESRRLYVRGLTVGYRFLANERMSLDVHLQPRFDGFENDDSPYLAEMDEPEPSVDLGLGLETELGPLDLGLSLDADVLGRSRGHEARVTLARTFVVHDGKVIVRPEAAASWQSGDLIDYYYGVDPSEARPGRPAYEGDSGRLFDVGAFLSLRIAPRWRVIGLARWTSLPDAVTGSPIVEDDSTVFGLLGLTFDLRGGPGRPRVRRGEASGRRRSL